MQANGELAAELNTLSETTAVARTTATRLRREVARLTKLQSLCADELVALLVKREETEAWHAASARELEDLEASITVEHKRNEVGFSSLVNLYTWISWSFSSLSLPSTSLSFIAFLTQVRHGASEDAHRERDVLVQGLSRAGDRARAALEVVSWQVR